MKPKKDTLEREARKELSKLTYNVCSDCADTVEPTMVRFARRHAARKLREATHQVMFDCGCLDADYQDEAKPCERCERIAKKILALSNGAKRRELK